MWVDSGGGDRHGFAARLMGAPLRPDLADWRRPAAQAWHSAACGQLWRGSELSAARAAAARAAAAAADALGVRARADAWASPAATRLPQQPGACPLGFGGTAAVGVHKPYPEVHLPPTWSLLTPHKLLWLLLKNTGIVLLLQTNLWLYQALEAEEAALQQGTQAQLPPYPDVLQQLVKALRNSWRELLTMLTRSEIKHAIKRSASSRTAWKVLKDPRASLTSKALFYEASPAWSLLPMYANTVLRTQLPTYAAELIVACSYDALDEAARVIQVPKPTPQQAAAALQAQQRRGLLHALGLAGSRDALSAFAHGRASVDWLQLHAAGRRWAVRAAKNLLRVSGTALCAAAGAAVAGALAPRERAGVWGVRGLVVTDLLMANLLLVVLDGGLGIPWPWLHDGGGGGGEAGAHQQQHSGAGLAY